MRQTPAELVYRGYSAKSVCECLKTFPPNTRQLHAVDALIVAILYNRLDTFNVLVDIGTPFNLKSRHGLTVFDALSTSSKKTSTT